MNVVSLDEHRFRKKRASDIEKLTNMLIALREAYATLKPFLWYPITSAISNDIIEAREVVLSNIEMLQKQEKEDYDEEIHSN